MIHQQATLLQEHQTKKAAAIEVVQTYLIIDFNRVFARLLDYWFSYADSD